MAVTATRTATLTYTGDVVGTETLSAGSNASSPGSIEIKTLASGFNTVTLPTGGSTVVSVTIVPPSANSTSIILKSITGDTGIRLHNTDPTTVTFHSTETAFGLTCGAQITGVRFYWT